MMFFWLYLFLSGVRIYIAYWQLFLNRYACIGWHGFCRLCCCSRRLSPEKDLLQRKLYAEQTVGLLHVDQRIGAVLEIGIVADARIGITGDEKQCQKQDQSNENRLCPIHKCSPSSQDLPSSQANRSRPDGNQSVSNAQSYHTEPCRRTAKDPWTKDRSCVWRPS